MNGLEITVTGASAQLTGEALLTGGMVGLPVSFLFDEIWEGLRKTAVFRAGGKTVSCLDAEDSVSVPWEVMEQSGCTLEIGVYGQNGEGSLVIPTVWVTAGLIQPGTDPGGDLASEPAVKIWDLALESAQQAQAVAQSVRDDADRGLFRGEKGEKGDAGIQGPQGKQGVQGPAGPQGEKGDKGDRGEQGKQGVQGPRGYQGARGEKGNPGAAGKDGADGYTPVKGIDYYTEAEKTELVSAVLSALPTYNGEVESL